MKKLSIPVVVGAIAFSALALAPTLASADTSIQTQCESNVSWTVNSGNLTIKFPWGQQVTIADPYGDPSQISWIVRHGNLIITIKFPDGQQIVDDPPIGLG